ncbi:succinate--CoA ligase subunit alpha [Solicola gregarius]|uniref:CoA-binding protein n=1 Tax=Solicola gregarius TaxID=2908642 RepID=A0AA46TM17_9ACTN|nr:CoA-binding protein [Solicola gregarius]UYM07792.1 CoA-binding protein [Solicola gregarius]
MIVTAQHAVLVQGITGRQGQYWTERMEECGTRVVAGASPGRAGREVHGVPVYDTAADAAAAHDLDATVLFVPPARAKDAVVDAAEAGIRTIVCLAEHIPSHDVMEMLAVARECGSVVVGPNTAGLVVPGQSSVGIMPGFAPNIFRPGRIGVVSRSGSLGTLVCMNLVTAGFGQSAFIGVGGDPILGTTTADAVRALVAHPATEAIVIVGEIGGSMEEDAAEVITGLGVPTVAFIAGRSAPPDRRMGHAGAIVTGDRGSADTKVAALRGAGVAVVDIPSEIGTALRGLGVGPHAAVAAGG